MSNIRRYEVIVEGNDAEGYSAFLPSLLGCVTAAGAIEEVKDLIVDAVGIHIDGMIEDGLPLPEPLSPEQAEKTFGIPIPESVVSGLFIEISEANRMAPVNTAPPNPKTKYEGRLVAV